MTESELLGAARRAAGNAYCEYSQFPVGAAVAGEDGRVFEACNVENASYGLSICAERAAVFAAVAAGVRRISRMAVSCTNGDPARPSTLMPCGACRQVIAEFATPDFVLFIDKVGARTLPELLPLPFKP
jgi:cytidine deaminase